MAALAFVNCNEMRARGMFHTGAELNAALSQINAAGGSLCPNPDPSTGFRPRIPLPLVRDDLEFGDNFSSLDLRVSKSFKLGERVTIEPIAEVFNLFNVTNVLGVSNVNYSGFQQCAWSVTATIRPIPAFDVRRVLGKPLPQPAVCLAQAAHGRFSLRPSNVLSSLA